MDVHLFEPLSVRAGRAHVGKRRRSSGVGLVNPLTPSDPGRGGAAEKVGWGVGGGGGGLQSKLAC